MDDFELLRFNSKGFIPGPWESEGEFLERVGKSDLGKPPCPSWSWSRSHLRALFDFEPESLNVVYSNKNLAPWQGAVCWIEADGTTQLQLREGFKKGSYLGIYSRDEILSHEAVHAARAAFNEEQSEEFFAYATSEKRWRQVLGPILKHPYESWVMIGLLAVSLFYLPFLLLLTLWLSLGFYRLIKQHRRLAKASLVLFDKLRDQKKVRSVLLRLTDREITDLAKGNPVEGDLSLRWRLIRLAYFSRVVPNQ